MVNFLVCLALDIDRYKYISSGSVSLSVNNRRQIVVRYIYYVASDGRSLNIYNDTSINDRYKGQYRFIMTD
jgi:hypothetical protein